MIDRGELAKCLGVPGRPLSRTSVWRLCGVLRLERLPGGRFNRAEVELKLKRRAEVRNREWLG